MRVAIQYALSAPARLKSEREALDLAALGSLTFRATDPVRFPCLRLVKEACEAGGCATAVLAAADEWAVAKFIAGEIGYMDIPRAVEGALAAAPKMKCDSIDSVISAAEWTTKWLERGFKK